MPDPAGWLAPEKIFIEGKERFTAATELTPYRIDIEDALVVWEKACGPTSTRLDLVPGQAIGRYNATHERPLERVPLADWTAFEYGHVDWDHHDFARLLGLDDIPAGSLVLGDR